MFTKRDKAYLRIQLNKMFTECINFDHFDNLEKYNSAAMLERVSILRGIFLEEKLYHLQQRRHTFSAVVEDWLRGLPSSCTVDFSNHDILKLGIKSKVLTMQNVNYEEPEAEAFVDWYWKETANYLAELMGE